MPQNYMFPEPPPKDPPPSRSTSGFTGKKKDVEYSFEFRL